MELVGIFAAVSVMMLDSRTISVSATTSVPHDDVPMVNGLHGYICKKGSLGKISEEYKEGLSEFFSAHDYSSSKNGSNIEKRGTPVHNGMTEIAG